MSPLGYSVSVSSVPSSDMFSTQDYIIRILYVKDFVLATPCNRSATRVQLKNQMTQ